MYYFGEDSYAARQRIGEVAGEAHARIQWLDRDHLDQKPFSEWLDRGTSSLFGKELLVVRDPSGFPKSIQEEIVNTYPALGGTPPKGGGKQSIILWDRVKPDKRSSLFRALKKHSQEFPVLSEAMLVDWLQQEAAQRKGILERSAARELVMRSGTDRWKLLNELEQLLLEHENISLSVIQKRIPIAGAQEEVFVLLDALMAGNKIRAFAVMEALLRGGENEFYILSMLAYQFRTLLDIKNGKSGLHPFVVQKNKAVAQRISSDAALDSLTRILAVDVAIKQGKVDARTAIVMLVNGLVTPMRFV